MLDASTSNSINSFLPIFYISKYFGCNLYPLPKSLNAANIKTKLRVVDVFICLIQLCLAFGVSIPLIVKWNDKGSPLRRELEQIISMSSVTTLTLVGSAVNFGYVIIYLVIMFFDMINAPVIRGILFWLGNFDVEVEKQGVKINFSYRYMTIAYVTIMLLNQILAIGFAFELLGKEENGYIGMVFEVYVGNVVADGCIYSFYTTYWFFLENVANRINFINQRLRRNNIRKRANENKFKFEESFECYHRLFNRRGQGITSDSGKTVSVHDLSMMHYALLDIIREVNHCYASQFVLCTAITFFFSVINLFVVYKTVTLEVEIHTSSIMILFYTCRSFYFNYYFYKIIEVGSRIKSTKLVTQSLLNKANVLCCRENDHARIKSFSHQLSHSNLEVTCGLFPVDWTILYTILSAMGTYLLWFIQFDKMGTTGTVTTV